MVVGATSVAPSVSNLSSIGGYLALYNKQLMATWGSDDEQWRGTLGYVAPHQAACWVTASALIILNQVLGCNMISTATTRCFFSA
jgi:hypothetical protein